MAAAKYLGLWPNLLFRHIKYKCECCLHMDTHTANCPPGQGKGWSGVVTGLKGNKEKGGGTERIHVLRQMMCFRVTLPSDGGLEL